MSKEFTIETNTPAAATLYYPRLVTKRGTGPDDTEVTGIAIANLGAAQAELTIRAFDREGIEIRGEKITNPLSLKLPPLEQRAIIDFQLFGKDLAAQSPVGWIKLESTGKKLVGFFLAFDDSVSVIDSARTGLTATDPATVFPVLLSAALFQPFNKNPVSETLSESG